MILGLYAAALTYITIYCLMQFHLLVHYKRFQKRLKTNPVSEPQLNGHLPTVTIQLPIYNEFYVIERLIDAITKFNYPKHKFEIHILDDSTDETVGLVEKKMKDYVSQGFQIEHIRRTDRKGYKAGALKEGMKYAKGEFIAIFDADFLPKPDFLRKTLPYFENPEIGVVQTRWEHINENYSILTELQAFQLNVHFTVEQLGRCAGNYMLQFNGTAGVWRKSCIDDAGGWEADTLTEDLDLSYRAQMKGWKIIFLEEVVSPAELPAEMSGLKSQQFRWMKGGAETARKMLPTVWNSKLKLIQKIHATSHLLSSSVFLCVFLVGVFSVPLLFVLTLLGIERNILAVFIVGLLSISVVYYVANVQNVWKERSRLKTIAKFIVLFPVFLSLSMGLSLHNSIAVIQGYIGKKSPFVRTPKFNISGITDSLKNKKYLGGQFSKTTLAEGLLAIYFMVAMIAGLFWMKDFTFALMHFLLMMGYGTIFYHSVKDLKYQ
jgi:cellulose synthase/poly-beta-1,6-N-acetylglucosamine synthase-like glycosyltransferase